MTDLRLRRAAIRTLFALRNSIYFLFHSDQIIERELEEAYDAICAILYTCLGESWDAQQTIPRKLSTKITPRKIRTLIRHADRLSDGDVIRALAVDPLRRPSDPTQSRAVKIDLTLQLLNANLSIIEHLLTWSPAK